LPSTDPSLAEIAESLRSRATGVLDAADDHWAEDMEIWHSFDDRVQRIKGRVRAAHSRAKLAAFHRAMPSFERIVTILLSPSTSSIIELTTWTGRMDDAPGVINADGVTIGNKSVTIYRVAAGKIVRMDIFDDPAESRASAELTAYGGMSSSRTASASGS
jgi:ketosteroid isomerase-like protein